MGWLGNIPAWWGPLQRGDLIHRITGQLATIFSVFIWRCLVWGVGVVGSSGILILYRAWYFCRGWLHVQLEYLGLCGSHHWWHNMGRRQLLLIFYTDVCMTAILDLQAQPDNSMPYVHIGVMMDLYSRSLYIERWDVRPSNQ